MTQEPKLSRRVVSKREYAAQLGSIVGLSALGVALNVCWIVGVFVGVLATCLLLLYGYISIAGFLLIAVVGGTASLSLKDVGKRITQKANQMKPDVPLTRANTADLPANDSLVRASQEPTQAQEGVLLRAASGEMQNGQEAQLLRSSAEGQNTA